MGSGKAKKENVSFSTLASIVELKDFKTFIFIKISNQNIKIVIYSTSKVTPTCSREMSQNAPVEDPGVSSVFHVKPSLWPREPALSRVPGVSRCSSEGCPGLDSACSADAQGASPARGPQLSAGLACAAPPPAMEGTTVGWMLLGQVGTSPAQAALAWGGSDPAQHLSQPGAGLWAGGAHHTLFPRRKGWLQSPAACGQLALGCSWGLSGLL